MSVRLLTTSGGKLAAGVAVAAARGGVAGVAGTAGRGAAAAAGAAAGAGAGAGVLGVGAGAAAGAAGLGYSGLGTLSIAKQRHIRTFAASFVTIHTIKSFSLMPEDSSVALSLSTLPACTSFCLSATRSAFAAAIFSFTAGI